MPELATPIAHMIAATNAGDSEAFVACFSQDAYLEDWGRVFRGHDGVARWNQSDNIGTHAHFEAKGVSGDATDQVVTLVVTGGGFNGTSDITFRLRDGLIEALIISPD